MEIGLSTASFFNKLSIEDAVVDIGKHGVSLCELFLNSFSEYEPAFIDMLYERMEKACLSAYSVHPMGIQFETLLFSSHERQRADSFRIYEHVLQCCKTLGASHYVMHGGANLSGVPSPGLRDYERLANIFSALIDMANAYGVTLTLENVSWCLFSTPEFGVRLRDAIGSHALKFTLDVKQALRMGVSPLDFIEAIGDDVENLHLCDADLTAPGQLVMRMPGQGNVDFAAIGQALHAKGYKGPAFIEVYGNMYSDVSTLYESLAVMRTVLTNF